VKSGRDDGFSRLFETYSGPLRRLCAAYLEDPSDRQDLFQEIAMALWAALPHFRAEASERTWLYRIAHNVALTYSAKRRRQYRTENPIEDASLASRSHDDTRRIALLEAVRQLEPADRHLAVLYLEGLTGREMADVTGLTENHIGVKLTRLRQKLAVILHGKGVQS
jgi:RNA polymerase sigma-70 factor (ECF subfamily)